MSTSTRPDFVIKEDSVTPTLEYRLTERRSASVRRIPVDLTDAETVTFLMPVSEEGMVQETASIDDAEDGQVVVELPRGIEDGDYSAEFRVEWNNGDMHAVASGGDTASVENLGSHSDEFANRITIDLVLGESVTIAVYGGTLHRANVTADFSHTFEGGMVPSESFDGGIGLHMKNEDSDASNYEIKIGPSHQVVTLE